jgi:branched-chain amino acid transport system ATP-binding protein
VTGAPVLDVREICKSFGGLQAVTGVSFTASGGEVLGIAGPNGAGKTTLFDVITGQVRATSGDVLLCGRSIASAPVHARARLGLARTFQQPTVADSLTVAENMLLAASFRRAGDGGAGGTADRRSAWDVAGEFLEFTGLAGLAGRAAGPLGVFDKKRLMLGGGLAMGALALLLDEPFGGLSPAEIDEMIGLIGRVAERGVAVVCIEHVTRALVSLADRVVVMHHGAVFFQGTPAQMLADDRVIEVYLGSRYRRGGGENGRGGGQDGRYGIPQQGGSG